MSTEFDIGSNPSLPVSGDGKTVVEIHSGDYSNKLFYRVGKINNEETARSLMNEECAPLRPLWPGSAANGSRNPAAQ